MNLPLLCSGALVRWLLAASCPVSMKVGSGTVAAVNYAGSHSPAFVSRTAKTSVVPESE